MNRGLITTLDTDLFKYTPNLQMIAFYNNKIEHIGENLVGNLTKLQQETISTLVEANQNLQNRIDQLEKRIRDADASSIY